MNSMSSGGGGGGGGGGRKDEEDVSVLGPLFAPLGFAYRVRSSNLHVFLIPDFLNPRTRRRCATR